MTREQFIAMAKDLDLEVIEGNQNGWPEDYDGVYAMGKEVTLRNGDRYNPYVRVSGFNTGNLYMREDGYCSDVNDDYIRRRLKKLANR